MSSLHNQLKDSTLQGCLAVGIFPTGGASHEVRSGGSFLSRLLTTTLLGYWNTGTLLPSRKLADRIMKSLCLAGEDLFAWFTASEWVAGVSAPPRTLLETLEP